MRKRNIYLILNDIRSAHNVGSMFRTADTVGIKRIFLTGYTPRPVDRFNRPVKEIAKTALGAEKTISWEHELDVLKVIQNLKKEKVEIIALEQSPKAVDYKKVKIKNDTAFIVGNEVLGISEEIIKVVDVVAEIPMQGKLARDRSSDDKGKESLNVSVALGVALFRILDI
ncbi:MAG: TrmH family RNA methyltransferase [Candidatus Paceibacterota bacterium]|jgi:tRNA G18 (ribose-2'-O)-methylase SpoU